VIALAIGWATWGRLRSFSLGKVEVKIDNDSSSFSGKKGIGGKEQGFYEVRVECKVT